MIDDHLWIEGQPDDLNVQPVRRRAARALTDMRLIGCPLWWFRQVFPTVHGKNELAVALYIYRLRVIRGARTVAVTNARLLTELGIDRFAKYRALRRLAEAGIIKVKRHNQRALEITFSRKRVRAK
jgi:hypothetical protein